MKSNKDKVLKMVGSLMTIVGAVKPPKAMEHEWVVETRFGPMSVHPIFDSGGFIALKFLGDALERVRESLGVPSDNLGLCLELMGGSLNGYSGKWNIHCHHDRRNAERMMQYNELHRRLYGVLPAHVHEALDQVPFFSSDEIEEAKR